MTKAVYFVPVEKKFFHKWEYYIVDLDMLQNTFSEVIVCHNNLEFCKALLLNKIDLVYCWWWHQSAFPITLSRVLKIPSYTTGAVHMYDESGCPDFFSKGFVYRALLKFSWRFSSVNLFISKSQFRQITSHVKVNQPIVLQSSLSVNYNPVNLDTNVTHAEEPPTIKLLTVLWMTKDTIARKSIYEILDALALCVQERVTNFQWTIAGIKGDGSADLEERIITLRLQNFINILYDVSTESKEELFQSSDLYLQPSYYEGFGNAVLEAMSFGLPALVSRNTAQAEVIGNSGLMVEEIDAPSISAAVIKFINLTHEERQKHRNLVSDTINERHLFQHRLKKFKKILSKYQHNSN